VCCQRHRKISRARGKIQPQTARRVPQAPRGPTAPALIEAQAEDPIESVVARRDGNEEVEDLLPALGPGPACQGSLAPAARRSVAGRGALCIHCGNFSSRVLAERVHHN